MTNLRIDDLDHLVLTVADIETTRHFYEEVLGMVAFTFGGGRTALSFGNTKINLHQAGKELSPHALHPVPGSADLCLVTRTPFAEVLLHLKRHRVTVVEGPVPREGATGPMLSVYVRDPDGNLIEIASYNEA
ncbi:MAG: VOC family protein [Bilophila sp.]